MAANHGTNLTILCTLQIDSASIRLAMKDGCAERGGRKNTMGLKVQAGGWEERNLRVRCQEADLHIFRITPMDNHNQHNSFDRETDALISSVNDHGVSFDKYRVYSHCHVSWATCMDVLLYCYLNESLSSLHQQGMTF